MSNAEGESKPRIVRCQNCKEKFYWDRIPDIAVALGATSEDPPSKYYPKSYSFPCPKCKAMLTLSSEEFEEIIDAKLAIDPKSEVVKEEIIDAKLAIRPENDQFWMDYGRGLVNNTLTLLDDRAKNMITVCASLIVVNFGLLLVFKVEPIIITVTPQIFFAISAVFFIFSYSPVKKKVPLDSPTSIRDTYEYLLERKSKWHKWAFFLFVLGLFAIALTALLPDFLK